MTYPRALVALALPALLLTACAAEPGSSGLGPDVSQPIAAPGEVTGQGMVLQVDGKPAVFCLGAIMESYPPQCSGPELAEWEWPDDQMWESSNGVTWGTYAITGTWDGVRFTPTYPPIPLALYDPIRPEPDPRTDPANAADNSEELLTRVQDELSSWTDVTVLSTYPENGYLWVSVYYDDGTIQAYLDEVYGPNVVAVQSAFRDLPTLD